MTRTRRTTSTRYLVTFAGAFLLITALVLGLNVVGYRTGLVNPSQRELLDLRTAEMAAVGDADLVFIGDSSLARSIDEEMIADSTGLSVRSYPLTAAFGYAGTYNMLRKVIASDRPKTIVILQTPRAATEPPSNVGYLLSAKGLDNELATPDLIKAYLSVPNALTTLRNLAFYRRTGGPTAADLAVYKSYRKDNTVVVADRAALERLSARDKRGKAFLVRDNYVLKLSEDPKLWRWVDRMAAACDDAGVRCVWMNGPLYSPYCQANDKVFADLDRRLAGRGLQVANDRPFCLDISQVDDLPEHPIRRMTPEVTRWYGEKLRKAGVEGKGPAGS